MTPTTKLPTTWRQRFYSTTVDRLEPFGDGMCIGDCDWLTACGIVPEVEADLPPEPIQSDANFLRACGVVAGPIVTYERVQVGSSVRWIPKLAEGRSETN